MFTIVFAVLGMIIAVMSDALVVERVKFEKKKGEYNPLYGCFDFWWCMWIFN